jgi:hypothetical protein
LVPGQLPSFGKSIGQFYFAHCGEIISPRRGNSSSGKQALL